MNSNVSVIGTSPSGTMYPKVSLQTSSYALSCEVKRLSEENKLLKEKNQVMENRISELQVYMQMAFLDALTGLPNRRYFQRRILEEINRVEHGVEEFFSIIMIDVNDFKKINDTYGHATGDEVLKWVSAFLIGNVRTHDVCCRLAGDEFVIILPNVNKDGCKIFVDRIQQQLSAAQNWLEIPIKLSVGTATFPTQGQTEQEIFDVADHAMYQDKELQKGRQQRSMRHSRRSITLVRGLRTIESQETELF